MRQHVPSAPVFTRRKVRRLGAWLGLVLLALDIFLGTAIPVARAAQLDRLIPIADLAVCTMDGMRAVADRDGQSAPAEASVFCSACLPLVHLLAPPVAPVLGQPARIHAFLFTAPPLPWRAQTAGLGFSARAPPLSV